MPFAVASLNLFLPFPSNEMSAICLFQPAANTGGRRGKPGWHKLGSWYLEKGMSTMTKTLDVITEAIRSSKHPFSRTDNRPKKAHKHRYERRKIKEYLQLGDWLTEEAT
jgi:hypothetical protein